MFTDPRNVKLAKVFVDHSLKVKKGDKVKDMRKKGSQIYVDGKKVFEDGKWL